MYHAFPARLMILLLLVLALPLAGLACAQDPPADEDLQVVLDQLVADGKAPGIVLGIARADGTSSVLSSGTGGPGTPPLGPRSVFEIGSINKTLTGVLLADMVAKGEVTLEDPVAKYLPADVTVPTFADQEITLLDLATHTSGLPGLPGDFAPTDPADPYAAFTVDTMYEFLSKHELRRAPGAEYEYSNLAMGVLGHSLARAAGTTYEDLVRERILEPLGMTMTADALEGEVAEWMTKGHSQGEVVPYWFTTEAIRGAGGLRSNMEDMLKYLQANLGDAETDLERAMRDAHNVQRPMDRDGWDIGLGWWVDGDRDRGLVQHSGGIGGLDTYIGFDQDREIGFVLLTNTSSFEDDLGRDFLRRRAPFLPASTSSAPTGVS